MRPRGRLPRPLRSLALRGPMRTAFLRPMRHPMSRNGFRDAAAFNSEKWTNPPSGTPTSGPVGLATVRGTGPLCLIHPPSPVTLDATRPVSMPDVLAALIDQRVPPSTTTQPSPLASAISG